MNSADQLEQLLTLSEEMLRLALSSDWDRVVEVQGQRSALIEKSFPLDEAVALTDAQAHLKKILSLEAQVTALAVSAKKELGDTLGKINQGKQATKAYTDTSRG
ncbi:MAG: hypothetical protein C0631_02960 [Sedimenticola sp.]|jgi:hypothetical protein|nr:MAG: hypothetical protein C0631_02960 [Sedimenticola sp.]